MDSQILFSAAHDRLDRRARLAKRVATGAVSPDSARSCRLAYEPKPGFFVERPGSAIFLTGVTNFTPPPVKAFYKDRRFAVFSA